MDVHEKQALEELVKASAEKGTENALIKMGLDTNSPIDMQKDLAFLRGQREANEQFAKITRRVLISTLLVGALAWLGRAIWHAITDGKIS